MSQQNKEIIKQSQEQEGTKKLKTSQDNEVVVNQSKNQSQDVEMQKEQP